MRSFRNYEKEETIQQTEGKKAEELTKKIAEAYNGTSSMDMFKSILAEAERSKRAGTLSNQEIEAFYQNFAPMLDNTQKRRLRAVVDRLNDI